MNRTPLRRVSKKKASWNALYREAKKKRYDEQIAERGCTFSELSGINGAVKPHHYQGRWGDNLLKFIFILRSEHDRIHKHPNEARKQDLLVDTDFTACHAHD